METETRFKVITPDRDYSKINRENMETYLSAAAQLEMLSTMVITPFETALKTETGYSKENIPAEVKTLDKRIGNHMFYFTVTPTSSPSYAAVFDEVSTYIEGLKQGSEEERRRDGVRTSEEGVFVRLDDLVARYNDSVDANTEKGVKIEIRTSKGKKSKELTEAVLELDYARDFSETTAANARDYLEAKKIYDAVKGVVVDPFEKAVKEQPGRTKDNVADDEICYDKFTVGNVLCHIVSSRAESVKYGKILDGFRAYLEGIAAMSEEQRSSTPELRRFDGKAYVSLDSAAGTLAGLKSANTSPTLRQNVHYLRKPKEDRIIVE